MSLSTLMLVLTYSFVGTFLVNDTFTLVFNINANNIIIIIKKNYPYIECLIVRGNV